MFRMEPNGRQRGPRTGRGLTLRVASVTGERSLQQGRPQVACQQSGLGGVMAVSEEHAWGWWPGTVTPAMLGGHRRVTGFAVAPCSGTLAWTELDTAGAGATRLRVAPADSPGDAWTLPGFSVRSRLHEYGGLAVWSGTEQWPWIFVEEEEQGLWVLDGTGEARLICAQSGLRYGDCDLHGGSERLVSLEEDTMRECTRVVTFLMQLGNAPEVIGEADEFCASPRISPDGRFVAWIGWNAPAMPWTRTRLRLRDLRTAETRTVEPRNASLIEPRWAPDGLLYCLCDMHGWWQLHRVDGGNLTRINADPFDLGRPPWQLGFNHYAPTGDGETFAVAIDRARCGLIRLDGHAGLKRLPVPDVDITQLQWDGKHLWYLGAPADDGWAISRLDPASGHAERVVQDELRPGSRDAVSVPELIAGDGDSGQVYGFLYRPHCPGVRGPGGTSPPLLVRAHGGPTAMRSPAWSPEVQFWTGRGVAVLEVNYSGSSGHGRRYRERLHCQWGTVDSEDCIRLAVVAVAAGEADGHRCIIAGNSAGGLTVLNALRGETIFAGGLCRWGVTDLERLAAITHRFERGYVECLLGRASAHSVRYRERSPLHNAADIRKPVLFIQGEDDRIVPAEQAEKMVEAMNEAGTSAELHLFPGEGHGLRRDRHIQEAIMAELQFVRTLITSAAERAAPE